MASRGRGVITRTDAQAPRLPFTLKRIRRSYKHLRLTRARVDAHWEFHCVETNSFVPSRNVCQPDGPRTNTELMKFC